MNQNESTGRWATLSAERAVVTCPKREDSRTGVRDEKVEGNTEGAEA